MNIYTYMHDRMKRPIYSKNTPKKEHLPATTDLLRAY